MQELRATELYVVNSVYKPLISKWRESGINMKELEEANKKAELSINQIYGTLLTGISPAKQ